ncbi:MAG: ABC transporter substrate-binding protein [Lachnospiraceae bacterium]|nr:ABC transporter substrate-binding protein [Lachnospiraceae bacterium]
MKKKFLSILLTAAMTAALVTGCGGGTTSEATADSGETASAETTESAPTGEEDNIVRIGVVCAMTGGSAIYGEGAQNAVDLAVEEINSSDSPIKVEIVNGGKVVDDAKDSKQAVNAYNSLIPESPEAVVGSFFSSVTLPMAELANEQNMLLLATGATNYKVTLIGPTIFRNCFIDPYQGKMAALFAKDQGASKVAIIYAKDDDYSNGLKDAFLENAEANGLEIVYTGECTTTDTDFTAQASQAVASGADFLFYPCFLDTVPLLVQQARDAGFEGIIMGGDGWDGSDTTGLESYFDNCYFTNHYSSEDTAEAVQNFVTKYTEKYGSESLNACAALYYDAIYMLVQAAKAGGGTDTASLVKGMTGMTFTGVGGTFTLDENGDPEKSVAINTYENGEVKWFKTLSPEGK